MNGRRFHALIICLAAALCAAALAFAEDSDKVSETILFRWVDADGAAHYTDNFNAIPREFKAGAMQGRFVVDEGDVKPIGGKPVDEKPTEPEAPRFSNRLEDLGRSFYQEDGLLRLQGKVRNGFSYPISYVKVTVNFLDENESFVRAESTYADPIELQPGGVGTYTLVVRYSPEIRRYQPEFDWKK